MKNVWKTEQKEQVVYGTRGIENWYSYCELHYGSPQENRKLLYVFFLFLSGDSNLRNLMPFYAYQKFF